MRRLSFAALIAVAGLLMLTMSTVFAGGKGAQTFTEHVHNETEVFFGFQPCSEPPIPGRITITENGVFHVTELPNGTFHVTGTFTGDFLFEPVIAVLVPGPDDELLPIPADPPLDTSKPSFSGHFTQWFGDNHNRSNANTTFTFHGRGIGSDGSVLKFHQVAHLTAEGIDFSTDPPTITGLKVEFDRLRCD